jgi:hypothetical protein
VGRQKVIRQLEHSIPGRDSPDKLVFRKRTQKAVRQVQRILVWRLRLLWLKIRVE